MKGVFNMLINGGPPIVRKEITEMITKEMLRDQELKKLLFRLKEEKSKVFRNELAIRRILNQMWELMPGCITQLRWTDNRKCAKKTLEQAAARLPYCFYIKEA
jgi:hypothetical protein